MHQAASAILSFFLSPWNWIIIWLIAAWVFRKRTAKKFCTIVAICLFILFGNQAFLNFYAKKWQPLPVAVNSLAQFSCGIVPGGFASPDAKGNGYFNSTADRFIQAVKLYKLGIVKHLLISGGNGKEDEKNFREAAWVKGELITFGVPDSAIFVEDRSNNTQDNAINSKHILDSLHLKPPFLLITSAVHIPRAALIFQKPACRLLFFPAIIQPAAAVFHFGIGCHPLLCFPAGIRI